MINVDLCMFLWYRIIAGPGRMETSVNRIAIMSLFQNIIDYFAVLPLLQKDCYGCIVLTACSYIHVAIMTLF